MSTAPEDFTLDSHERASPLWQKVERFIAHRIEKLHGRNETDLSPQDTAAVRAEIKALRALKRLGQEKPPQVDG